MYNYEISNVNEYVSTAIMYLCIYHKMWTDNYVFNTW